tara:strand:+ start:956 stop:1399 length:444 start_codon:yes stop_codon:yes gene_type:complete
MILPLLLLGSAWGEGLPDRPTVSAPIEDECAKVYPVRKGQSWPSAVRTEQGLPDCYGVLVPLSQYSDLLSTETWATAIAQQYPIDIAELNMQIDWYKARLEEANKPVPWMEKPSTQRWFGRIETLAVVVVVSAGLGATYYYTSGAGK